ncbi:MAG: hypothetical protein IJQ61_03815 [Bacteroidales bacterium]|nr:hypothetical protein [Bacteroidales bacterium]
MKKTVLTLIALLSCLIAAQAQSKNQATAVQETQARLLDVNANAYVKPLTVEVEVLPTGRIVDDWPLTVEQVKSMGGDLANIRSWGVFQSSKKHDCDLIVAATFDFKNDSSNPDVYKLTVVGFPANFVRWKTADANDYEWIRLEKVFTTDDYDKIKAIVK